MKPPASRNRECDVLRSRARSEFEVTLVLERVVLNRHDLALYQYLAEPILDADIKKNIGFKGFIMSDWKAVYEWEYALTGLDMQSGAQLDAQEWFDKPLRQAM